MVFFEIINYIGLINKLLLFLVNAVGLELILWGYVANRYTRPNRLFLLGAFYILLWANLDSLAAMAPIFLSSDLVYGATLWATRAVYALMALFFAGFYYFSLNFPAKNPLNKNDRWRENVQISLWTLFFVASFTPFIVKEVVFDGSLPMAAWISGGILFGPIAWRRR